MAVKGREEVSHYAPFRTEPSAVRFVASLPCLVRTNQSFSGTNLVTYQATAYTYDNSSGTNPSAWLTTLANTWNYKNSYGYWTANTLVQNDYTMDNAGQRLTNAITSGGTTRTETYTYDELNRLKTVDYGDSETQSYAFDAMGNRSSKGDSSTGTEGYTYNAANMLTARAGNSYTNDAAGNTLTGGGRTNTWDSQNRLVTCAYGSNSSSYVYGADGIRRQSTVNSTTTDFVTDNSMFVREKAAATGSSIATYPAGPRGPEYRRDDGASTIRWYLYDGLGSVTGEVDPSGSVTSSRKFDVYGLVRGGTSPGGTSKHKFVGALGHPSEDETGLVYMRARYYDPVLGRFTSQDPGRNGLNWTVYCSDDPTNRRDLSGRVDWSVIDAIICGIAGGSVPIIALLKAAFAESQGAVTQAEEDTLLRASSAGEDSLLRAASGTGQNVSEELLRGAEEGLLEEVEDVVQTQAAVQKVESAFGFGSKFTAKADQAEEEQQIGLGGL